MFGLRRVDSRRPWPATSNFIFIKASNSHRQGWNPEVVSVPTYIGADIGTYSRNVRFVPKADIVPPSTPPKLRRRNGFSCEALAVNKKG